MTKPDPTSISQATLTEKHYDSGRRDDLEGVDLGVLDLRGERDVEGAVLDFDLDGFDVGALGAAGRLEDIEVLERVALDVEAEDAFAGGRDALVGLGEVKLHRVLPVREFPVEGTHAVALGLVH